MYIETLLSPKDLPPIPDERKTGVIGIDCLRATSVMVTAMAVGVTSITPVSSTEAARTLFNQHPDWILAGEVEGLPPEGFHYGNSPLEFIQHGENLQGKNLIMSTTNGTGLLNRLEEIFSDTRHRIYIGSVNNRQALCQRIMDDGIEALYVCCAGQKGRIALEDVACAGLIVQGMQTLQKNNPLEANKLGDGSWLALSLLAQFPNPLDAFRESKHGRELIKIGLEEDLAYCAKPDQTKVVPIYEDKKIKVSK